MDRRRLECFVALAEELHFGRAASRSGISQPGLSQQLRQLEEQLQVQLLHRSKRQVSLTRAGEVFLDEARKILRSMSAAVELTRQTDDGLIGTLRVGTTPSALFITMPEILLRFRAALPEVHVDVQQMTTDEQLAALRSGEIHVGLLHPPIEDESVHCEVIAELPFKLVLSEENPLARKPTLTLSDLAHETFILFPRGVAPHVYDHLIALCHNAGFSPRTIIEISPAQSIVAMAACNLGVGFVAAHVQHYDRALAAYRTLESATPRLSVAAAYPRKAPAPLAQQFVAIGAAALAGYRGEKAPSDKSGLSDHPAK
ncbi:LysR family transcriptional regulator [Aurantimonas endophytica]|uniref:DNA-binding transcriptional LysR family regulator n=1 Tax=Aurantimonas endophytica TaxID=1522175 RepID=A0A7W6MPU8_9HYPH|nr:LysR family transcriptional regulator [Aurantimonas endophytica]MBB4003405.1 DNA-binding transcriptional LysR family regulator [Aurantimonas endophytica]MCO6404266.1 LysR family transcriptional regulator [Aurantimonas endophytica]